MKAYLINSSAQTITEVEYKNSAELRTLIGARWLNVAKGWNDGTTLYVDDEGLSKTPHIGFMVPGNCWPLCSNGIVVGPELDEDDQIGGDGVVLTRDPGITIEALRAKVTFMTEDDVRRWALANNKEPAVIVSGTVVARVGEVFSQDDLNELPF